jgi:hypothetical protein
MMSVVEPLATYEVLAALYLCMKMGSFLWNDE